MNIVAGAVRQTFRALSDPARLRILNFLRGGELCVGDLVHLLGVPQPTASRHLACLRKAGLVTARREGLWGFYALAEPMSAFHLELRNALDIGLNGSPEFAADTQSAVELRKAGGCCPQHSFLSDTKDGATESMEACRE